MKKETQEFINERIATISENLNKKYKEFSFYVKYNEQFNTVEIYMQRPYKYLNYTKLFDVAASFLASMSEEDLSRSISKWTEKEKSVFNEMALINNYE